MQHIDLTSRETPEELEELRKKHQRNFTAPLEFLPPADDGRPPSKVAGRLVALLLALLAVGAIAVGATVGAPGWDPRLAPFAEFVEEERGLPFLRPVPIGDTDLADYEAPLVRQVFGPPVRVPELSQAFRLLGVVDFDPAERAAAESDDVAAVTTPAAAMYVQQPERILLLNDVPIEGSQLAIVHSLTHALLDQHGLLSFADLGNNSVLDPSDPTRTRRLLDESDPARLRDALIDGDATRIENAFYEQMTAEERLAYHEASGTSLEGVRHPLVASDRFTIGAPFVELLVATEGVERLNQLQSLRGDGSSDLFVDVLGDLGQSVDALSQMDLPQSRQQLEEPDGEVGAFGWFLTLSPLVGVDQAFDAVIGYDDDAYAIFSNPNVRRTSTLRTCGRFDVFFDDADEASEFAAVVAVAGIDGQLRAERRSVTMDICDSLGDPESQTAAGVFPLIVANELAVHHLQSGESVETARCAAIAQARTVPIDVDLSSFTGYAPYSSASEPFISACR